MPLNDGYFDFKVIKKDEKTNARAGEFLTPHGLIKTPVFMPVGTNSAVKMLINQNLYDMGAEIILNNSYHMYLRAGTELIKKAGGLHKWQNWDRPILTDSGGIQEEAPSLGVPVLVLRDETERPEALISGGVKLTGTNTKNIVQNVQELLENKSLYKKVSNAINPYGDGLASKRIADILIEKLS